MSKCISPILLAGTHYVSCGQCMPCRINLKRIWSARLQLESLTHSSSLFVTLTYAESDEEKKMPGPPLNEDGEPTLKPKHLVRFVDNFRYNYRNMNATYRYFGVGEYGTKTQRPHYHLIMFGVGLDAEPIIAKTWKKGFVQVGLITPERCSYVAQYTTKKLTKSGSAGLGRRHPEFTRQSRRPALGSPAIPWLRDTMKPGTPGNRALIANGDVWNSVRIGGKIWPLGPQMRKQLRESVGVPATAVERAVHFGQFDPGTGEIFVPMALPQDYGPWADALNTSMPMVAQSVKKTKEIIDFPEAIKTEDKRKRVESKFPKTTDQI